MVDIVVETTTGSIRGARDRGTSSFMGIPFAAPPVGALRFAAPRPVRPWAGVRDALAYGPWPPQAVVTGAVPGAPSATSEDCLYLNVWSPDVTARLPVLVYFHGGAFLFGAGAIPSPAAATLLTRDDAVVVTLNYRVGVLGGFVDLSDADDLDFTPNLGILDQLAALQWVRDNIAAFGGDPEQVTIFGISAGGMSVGTLLGTPAARGLFHRAIAQSGAACNAVPPDLAKTIGAAFLASMGLGASTAGALAHADADALVDASNAFFERNSPLSGPAQFPLVGSGHDARFVMPFCPIVDGDLIPEDPLAAIAGGSAATVEVIVGTTLNEWNLFVAADPGTLLLDEDGVTKLLAGRMPIGGEPDVELARRLIGAYREAGRVDPDLPPWAALAAVESDRAFNIPCVRLTDAQRAVRRNTRSYLWTRPAAVPALGASHATDAPFFLGILDEPSMAIFVGDPGTAADFSRMVQDSWVAFAATGDPSTPALGPWPPAGDDRNTMLLGDPPGTAADPFADVLPLWDGLL